MPQMVLKMSVSSFWGEESETTQISDVSQRWCGEGHRAHFKVPFVLISGENGADYVSEHFIPERKSPKTTLKHIPLRRSDKQKSCF